jgi:hypothetical protein
VSVALVIQQAMRMSSAAEPEFSTIPQKRYDFGIQFLNMKYVSQFALQFLSQTFLIPKRIQTGININVHR